MILKRTLLAAGMLACLGVFTGCSSTTTTTATVALANMCQGAAASLTVATSLDKRGQITAAQVQSVSIAAATINGVCSQKTAPTDINGAIAAVGSSISAVAVIVSNPGK